MILKCKSIAHIHNSIGYILKEEKEHQFVQVDGLDMSNKNSIIADFNLFSNPKVKNGFVSLVISPSNMDKLTNEDFKKLVEVTLKELDLEHRQYFAVTHNNTKTPHCHVILNRISYDNKTWNDHHIAWKCKEASSRVAKLMNLESARERELTLNQLRKDFREVVRNCLNQSTNVTEFNTACNNNGISFEFELKKNGSVGTSLFYREESFKASEIDRNISFKHVNNQFIPSDKLKAVFENNERKEVYQNRFRKNISDEHLNSLRKFFKQTIQTCTSLTDLVNKLEQYGIKVHENQALKNELQLSYKGQYFTSMDLSAMFQFQKVGNELEPYFLLQKIFNHNIDRQELNYYKTDKLADQAFDSNTQNELLTNTKNNLNQFLHFGHTSEEEDENEEAMKKKRKKRRDLGMGR